MKSRLENDLWIPPQVWKLMLELGYWQGINAEQPNLWIDLSIEDVQATLLLFVYERRQFLKGLNDE